MEQSAVYQRFKDAAEALGHDGAAVQRLSAETVRLMADADGAEATATFVENMKNKLARQLRARARRATSTWIEEQVRQRFAGAAVRMPDDKIAVVYLDGMDEEAW